MPRERDVAAHLGVRARVVRRAGEAVDHAAELGRAVLAQDRARIVVGVADVADDRLADRARERDEARERLLLRLRAASGRSSSRARSRRSRRRAGAARAARAPPTTSGVIFSTSCGWVATVAQMSGSRLGERDRALGARSDRRPRRSRRCAATPAARARASTSSRSASNSGPSTCACESNSIASLDLALAIARAPRRSASSRSAPLPLRASFSSGACAHAPPTSPSCSTASPRTWTLRAVSAAISTRRAASACVAAGRARAACRRRAPSPRAACSCVDERARERLGRRRRRAARAR